MLARCRWSLQFQAYRLWMEYPSRGKDEKKEWNSYGFDCGLCRLRNIGSKLLIPPRLHRRPHRRRYRYHQRASPGPRGRRGGADQLGHRWTGSARSAGRIGAGAGRAGAIVALALGLIGVVLSVAHLGSSTGGFGTGSGRAGAIVALVLGLIGMNLGGLALARSRRFRSID